MFIVENFEGRTAVSEIICLIKIDRRQSDDMKHREIIKVAGRPMDSVTIFFSLTLDK